MYVVGNLRAHERMCIIFVRASEGTNVFGLFHLGCAGKDRERDVT